MDADSWQLGLARALRAVTDLFLPAPMRVRGFDEKQLLRARAFIRVSLLILCGLVVLYISWAVADGPFDLVSLTWGIYAAILAGNLLLVRATGRFHEVTIANNLLGLGLMVILLNSTGGIYSALVPLFLTGVATTGNFGGNRAIIFFFFGFLAVITGTYGWDLYQGSHGPDLHSRFAILVTALVLLVLANLSSQSARSKTRRMLQHARDAAIDGRRRAEDARIAAERALDNLRDAQAQMILQEKMASLGGMVAGVAHEVNTPVGLAVTGASQLKTETQRILALATAGQLRRSTFDEYLAVVDELAGLIEKNAVRAAELIQSFKEVAVDQSSDARRPFDLKSYLAEVLASLSPRIRHAGHAVELQVEDGIEMDGYPGAVAQIVTNLVINSIMHAYPDDRKGTLHLTARPLPGDLVELRYSDDGQGIAPDLWDRIFEPFFTTRRGTGGSGLGLHLLYSIVTVRLGGTVRVAAADVGGALFTLSFPRVAPRKEGDAWTATRLVSPAILAQAPQ